ncbi:aminotransferase class V-fold PLP-dependent enzyme [Frankia sp. R82]|nr:aminotransferase class V-fold PLP-dependent enzyme [Frankia sp. R82]MCM3886535.1 aminotransferase class V-fold PLP-dependent enzyme [Frankia sp. R82]
MQTPDAVVLSWPGAPQTAALLPVEGAGLQVPLAGGGEVEYANLDCAASAPCLVAVAEHVRRVLPYSASVHRGAGFASAVCTSLYEGARHDVARFVGARTDDVVLFTRNTTDAVNLLAHAVAATSTTPPPSTAVTASGADATPASAPVTTATIGDGGAVAGRRTAAEVVVFDLEHHANLLPWRRVGARCVAVRETLTASLAALAAELHAAPVRLLAVTGASNVTGEAPPLAHLARLAHAVGARLFVDAAQLVPHRRIDMAALGIDYLAFSGHKLYAPFGAGVLVGRADWLDAAPPYLAGGGAVREVGTASVDWAACPARHEAGTPNLAGATAIAAACRTLADLDAGAWHHHESALRDRLLDGLAALNQSTPGRAVVHRIWSGDVSSDDVSFDDVSFDHVPADHVPADHVPADARTEHLASVPVDVRGDEVGVVAFSLPGHDPALVSAYLSAEHGIGVRAGRFCAHPLLARLGAPGGALRASIGVGTTSAHIDRLLAALDSYLRTGPRLSYTLMDGSWQPAVDERRLPSWAEQYTAQVPGRGAAHAGPTFAPCGT